LSQKYHRNSRTIRKYLDQHFPATGEIKVPSQPINLIFDATFFRRDYGLIVCRADKKNIYWQEIKTERIEDYKKILTDLINVGFKFQAFTIDGRRGVIQLLNKYFPQTPIQLCQFHQIQIITRYLSRRPILLAGKELRALTLTLTKTKKEIFIYEFEQWHLRWKTFLKEKHKNFLNQRCYFVHRRLRSAYRSLQTNLPYLFTYLDYPKLKIPNTTNSCDGSFAHWKQKVKIHRGLSQKRRKKMIDYLLENS